MARPLLGVTVAVGACVGALLTAVPATGAPPSPTITPVLTGLSAPRGIAFDGSGAMYLAQAGVAGPGPMGITHTGSVSKYRLGSTSPVWSTSFTSIYNTEQEGAPPDVLGPSGISVLGTCGPQRGHHPRSANGCTIRMIMAESTPGIAKATGGAVVNHQLGHLFGFDARHGHAVDRADVGSQDYAWTQANNLFQSDFPDSNPYGVLVTRGGPGAQRVRTFVADAGANTIDEVMPGGKVRVVAYIPNETAAPFRDATPTCIAQGPDGYLYVGTLHLLANFALGDGQSDVWRVDPNAGYPTAPTLWASGLSTVTACTFDKQGNFWATEMFAGGPTATPPGDVVKIPFASPTTQTHIGAGILAVPGGIAQGPDGAMYVTVGSSAPGSNGAVVRVSGA